MDGFRYLSLIAVAILLGSCASTGPGSPSARNADAEARALLAQAYAQSGYSQRDSEALADRALRRLDGEEVGPYVRRDPVREGSIRLDPDSSVLAVLQKTFRAAGHSGQRAVDLAEVLLERRKGNDITVEDLENERRALGLE